MELDTIKQELMALKPDNSGNLDHFYDLFPQLSHALVSSRAIDENTILAVDTLTVWLTRAIQIQRRNTWKSAENLLDSYSEQLAELFSYVCGVYNSSSGPFASAVNGLLLKLSVFVNTLCKDANNTAVAETWVEMLLKAPSHQKAFFSISERIIREVDCTVHTLLRDGSFPTKCLEAMSSDVTANAAAKAFAAYYSRLHNPKAPAEYVSAWSSQVNSYLPKQDYTSNIISMLLPTLFSSCPPAFGIWMEEMRSRDVSIDLLLPLLKMGYSISARNDPVALQLVTLDELKQLLTHKSRSYREDAFAILCLGLGSKNAPRPETLDILSDKSTLSIFFQESNSPESRGVFFSTLRKSLINLRDFYDTQQKRSKKSSAANVDAGLRLVTSFVQRLYDYAVSQLLPDSSYHQLILSADLLSFLIEFGFDGHLRKKHRAPACPIIEIYNPYFAARLLRMTTNNYEDVRSRAYSIILECPYTYIASLQNETYLANSMKLLSSLKGRQSDAMAQLMSCFAQLYQKNDLTRYFALVDRLVNDVTVANSQAVHGHLTALAKILSATSSDLISGHHEYFRPIAVSLITTIKESWDNMKPALVSNHNLNVGPVESDTSDWRVIKESAHLLRVLIEVNYSQKWALLDQETFLEICDLLMNQLVEISHRGAFSSVSPTFIKACEICFDSTLEHEPLRWLKSNLDLLKRREQLISRRSAGIPLIFTSILTAASKVKERLDTFLKFTFQELFTIGNTVYSATEAETKDLPQVHSYNCLKSIFRERALSSGYQAYINDALKLSLTNINHPTWAIKNGALMLFTALQECLFGSESIDGNSNKTNAAFFFRKYPGIAELLLTAIQSPDASNANSIIPVLTILSSLGVFSDSDHSLQEFHRVIRKQSLGHPSWKIREMSARMMCNVTFAGRYLEVAMELLQKSDGSRNRLHGQLIAVKELLKARHSDEGLQECLQLTTKNFHDLLNGAGTDWVLARAYLEILSEHEIDDALLHTLMNLTRGQLKLSNTPNNGSLRIFLETAAAAILKSITSVEVLESFSKDCFTSRYYEVQLATARFWKANSEKFKKMTALHALVFDEIERKSGWIHIKEAYLELASDARLSAARDLTPQASWTKAMVVMSCGIKAITDQWQTQVPFILSCCQDSEPEDLRLIATHVAKRVAKSTKGTKMHAQLNFEIWRRHSDESGEVRIAAVSGEKCSVESSRLLLQSAEQEFFWEAVSPYFKNAIQSHLRSAVAERQNAYFEEERDNIFRNEVETHKALLDVLVTMPQFKTEGKVLADQLAGQISDLIDFATENTELLQVWMYDVHVDTAIRKALSCRALKNDAVEEQLSRLESVLVAVNYS